MLSIILFGFIVGLLNCSSISCVNVRPICGSSLCTIVFDRPGQYDLSSDLDVERLTIHRLDNSTLNVSNLINLKYFKIESGDQQTCAQVIVGCSERAGGVITVYVREEELKCCVCI